MAGQAKRKKEKEFSLLGGSRNQKKRWVNHERASKKNLLSVNLVRFTFVVSGIIRFINSYDHCFTVNHSYQTVPSDWSTQ